jgi:hypothetical protein
MKRLWLIVVVCALLAGCSVKPRLLKVDCTLRSAYWDSGCVIGAVAKDKATCYHCREPHYIQPKEGT